MDAPAEMVGFERQMYSSALQRTRYPWARLKVNTKIFIDVLVSPLLRFQGDVSLITVVKNSHGLIALSKILQGGYYSRSNHRLLSFESCLPEILRVS